MSEHDAVSDQADAPVALEFDDIEILDLVPEGRRDDAHEELSDKLIDGLERHLEAFGEGRVYIALVLCPKGDDEPETDLSQPLNVYEGDDESVLTSIELPLFDGQIEALSNNYGADDNA